MVEQEPIAILDLGNTRLKVALWQNKNLSEYKFFLRTNGGALLSWLSESNVKRCVILSTGSTSDSWYQQIVRDYIVWIPSGDSHVPFQVEYETINTLGVDRLVAVVAANALFPNKNVLVVDAGTCLTYEYLDAKRGYLGGNISPGMQMRLKAMHTFTARLPLVESKLPQKEIGTSTETALQLGGIYGIIQEIKQYIAEFENNTDQNVVVLTGGDSSFLQDYLPSTVLIKPKLVLEGLAHLYDYNFS